MYVLGVTDRGSSGDRLERVVDAAVDRLSEVGRVGVVRYDATIADGLRNAAAVGGDVTYDLGADGDWTASGTGLSVDGALEALAPDCDAAVVVGVDSPRYPAIVVDERADSEREGRAEVDDRIEGTDDGTGRVLATVTGPSDLEGIDLRAELESRDPYETLESLVAAVKRSPRADRAGAIATFTGRVRARDDPDDAPTEFLEFEKYEGVADERLAALREELESREGVHEVRLHHRTGVVESGEDIVFVVVLAGHREEAFRTVEDGINRLKEEVPLFKKEVTVDDEFWVHERE